MKRVIIFIGILVAIATLYACDSPSAKRSRESVADVIIPINDIVQDGPSVFFVLIDTIGYQMRIRPYIAHIANITKHSDSTVCITVAFPDSKEYFEPLPIKK
jgi:hypothetical protein